MTPILSVWAQFLFLALIIGFAGYRLTYYADKIAERTGFARNWIGLVLLATITSLPELMTGISSVRWAENTNLATGNMLGACVFNLSLVFILDWVYREGSIYKKSTQGHILTGAWWTAGIALESVENASTPPGVTVPDCHGQLD